MPSEFEKQSVEDILLFSDFEDAESERNERLKKRQELINTMDTI